MIRTLFTASIIPLLFACASPPIPPGPVPPGPQAAPLAIGILGLDTSHAVAFSKVFNDPAAPGELAGMRVVAGYPGGTEIPASKNRVDRFTRQLAEMGIEIVESIPELLSKVDVVLLESVDGRTHLDQARQVFEAGKPVFIDKPVAGSLEDVLAIEALARKYGVPWFSSFFKTNSIVS